MGDDERSGNGEENLAIGDTPSGSPAFIIYKKRLYVLSKKPPTLGRPGKGRGTGTQPIQAVEVRDSRPAPQRPYQRSRGACPARVRAARRRTRPYIKGTYRVYSSKFPHLAPADRRRARKRIPRRLE
jgi:hypothetical protein